MAKLSYGPNVLISLALLLLGVLAWIVLLAGASALQKNGDVIAPLQTANAATVVTGDLTPTSIARRFISYEWFKAVLQIVVLLFAIAMLAAGQFHRFRLAIVGLLAVCTVLFCDACQTFYYFVDVQEATAHYTTSVMYSEHNVAVIRKVRTWWAGCMMTAAINLLLILTIGSGLPDAHDQHAHAGGVAGGKPYRSDTAGLEGGRGTTVV